jgi:hypothetical protein
MIKCLRNWDLVLICCEVEADAITARWVQINPGKASQVLGQTVTVRESKNSASPDYQIEVPANLSPVHTDVRFPLISMGGE